MLKYFILLLAVVSSIEGYSQQDTIKNQLEGAFVTPDGDIILPEVTIETVDVKETTVWKTSHFYELAENEGRYKIKDGTKQTISRRIELNGQNKTLRVYDKKGVLKMHHDVDDVIRSENQLVLNFSNGSYMIIDSGNKTISLFEKNFGFVYKIKK